MPPNDCHPSVGAVLGAHTFPTCFSTANPAERVKHVGHLFFDCAKAEDEGERAKQCT